MSKRSLEQAETASQTPGKGTKRFRQNENIAADAAGVSEEESSFGAALEQEEYSHSEQEEKASEDSEDGEARDASQKQEVTQRRNKVLMQLEQKTELETDGHDAGIIKRVLLTNFMCHEKLEINLGSQINFITGRNGSGKSAILTGLTVCLGANARKTDRASSAKDFIRNDCESGSVLVELCNTKSPDSYKYEVYGSLITIERKLLAKGGGGYTIKGAGGKIKSTKRQELQNILDYFQIQVSNPLQILTQDLSRQFLTTKNATDKYNFFMQATHLARINGDYENANKHLAELKHCIALHSSSITDLKKQAKRAEEKFKALKSIKNLKEKYKRKLCELQWATVFDIEADIEVHTKSLEKTKESLEKSSNLKNGGERLKKEAIQKHQLLQLQSLKLGEDIGSFRREANQNKQELRNRRKAVSEFKVLWTDGKSNVSKYQHIKDQNESKIKEVIERSKQDMSQANAERRGVMEENTANMNDMSQLLAQIQHKREEGKVYLRSLAQKDMDFKNTKTQISSEIDQIAKDLNHSIAISKNDVTAWGGNNVKNILKEIQKNQNNFHAVPIGPIGQYIKLTDMKWGKAIDAAIGNSMDSFLVTDAHDATLLRRILKDCRSERTGMYVRKFSSQVYDITSQRAQINRPIVFEVIRSDKPMVINCMIDNHGVEQKVLFASTDNTMTDTLNRSRIPNCTAGIDINGDIYTVSKTGGGFLRANQNRRAPRFSEASEDNIQGLKEKKEELSQRRIHIAEEERSNKQLYSSKEREINGYDREAKDLERKIYQLQVSNEALDNEIKQEDKESGNYESVVNMYREEMNEMDEKIAAEQKSLLVHNEELNKASELLQEKEKECAMHEHEYAKRTESLRENESNVEISATEHSKCEKKIAKYEKIEKELESRMQEYSLQIKQLEKDWEECEKEARNMHAERIEIEADKDYEEFQREVLSLKEVIDRTENSQGNYEKVSQEYKNSIEQIENASKSFHKSRAYRKLAKKEMTNRTETLNRFQTFMDVRLQNLFTMFLRLNGSQGNIEIDHEQKKLALKIKTNDRVANAHMTDEEGYAETHSLSGGERSFGTLCFILSLWETMETPFRCMDEFDVFMDALNRTKSMEALIKVARHQKHRQFIFITPQDMSSIERAGDIKIHCLRPPVRSNREGR